MPVQDRWDPRFRSVAGHNAMCRREMRACTRRQARRTQVVCTTRARRTRAGRISAHVLGSVTYCVHDLRGFWVIKDWRPLNKQTDKGTNQQQQAQELSLLRISSRTYDSARDGLFPDLCKPGSQKTPPKEEEACDPKGPFSEGPLHFKMALFWFLKTDFTSGSSGWCQDPYGARTLWGRFPVLSLVEPDHITRER